MYNILKFKQYFESFEEKSFPIILKQICLKIRKDIISNGNNSFKKNYIVNDINVNIIINYTKGNYLPYYSKIDIYSVIENLNDDPIDVLVLVKDNDIKFDYLMS